MMYSERRLNFKNSFQWCSTKYGILDITSSFDCIPAVPKSGGCAVFHYAHQDWTPGNSPVLLVTGQCSSIETIAVLSELLPVRLWSKIACFGTSLSLLSLVCYAPMFRQKAVFLCGRHDRIISTWRRFTIIIYNLRKKVLLFCKRPNIEVKLNRDRSAVMQSYRYKYSQIRCREAEVLPLPLSCRICKITSSNYYQSYSV